MRAATVRKNMPSGIAYVWEIIVNITVAGAILSAPTPSLDLEPSFQQRGAFKNN